MMVISNSSDSNGTNRSQEILTKSFEAGSRNLTDKAMKMIMATWQWPRARRRTPALHRTEMYMLNDSMYMKIDGNWTKTKLLGLSLKDIWKQQDKMEQQRESLNGSNIMLLGMEKIDGTECYKVRVIPDMKLYTTVIKEQLGNTTILPYLNGSSRVIL